MDRIEVMNLVTSYQQGNVSRRQFLQRTAEAHIYEGAPYAFFNDERADAYRPEAVAESWQRTLAWFNTHLG